MCPLCLVDLYCRAMYFTLPSTVKPELRAVETQMLGTYTQKDKYGQSD